MNGLRIATINDLMNQMAEMFPLTFPDAKRISAWEPQYRASLSGLDGDELNAAWHAVFDSWKKPTAPPPADFLKAHDAIKTKRSAGPSRGEGSLADRLQKRDQELRELRRKLVDDFWQSHAKTRAAASQEGWLPLAETQIALGANMLAQRQQKRDGGQFVAGMRDDDRAYFGIYEIEGAEQLCITNAMIDMWREWVSTPAPPVPGRSSTFRSVGAAA